MHKTFPALLAALLIGVTSQCLAETAQSASSLHMKMAAQNPEHCLPGETKASAPAEMTPIPNADADKQFASLVTEVITVTGVVKHPLVLRVDDLKKFPAKSVKGLQMTCLDGANKGKMPLVRGALLRDILAKAELDAPGHNDVKRMIIVATASDGYKVVYSWAEVFNSTQADGMIVYYEKNGQPIGNDEGRIAMLSSKDVKTGPRHVKWLKSIEVKRID